VACGPAIQIIQNPTQFNEGIVIFSGSIVAGGGPSGTTPAIALPPDYYIVWESAANTLAAAITANGGTGNLELGGVGTIHINMNGGSGFGANCGVGVINPATVQVINGIVVHC
jgi:hypothetical protein